MSNEERKGPQEVAIPLTARQAKMLTQLYLERQQADQTFTLYASAIIAGTPHEGGTLIGLKAAENGSPAVLLLQEP